MSMVMDHQPVIGGEIEYKFLGIAVSTSKAVEESKDVKKARSRRRTRAVAKRLVSGVFKFPLCCSRPSTLDDDDEECVEVEFSRHIPYAPRKVPESLNQLIPYQRRAVPETRSQHLPHVQRKVPERLSNHLQRKVIIYPPSSGSTQREDQWRIGFENTSRWESPLQAWSLTGDSYLGVGEPGLHFDSREAAVAYAQTYGWSYRVEGEPERHQRNASLVGNYGWVELMRPAVKG